MVTTFFYICAIIVGSVITLGFGLVAIGMAFAAGVRYTIKKVEEMDNFSKK